MKRYHCLGFIVQKGCKIAYYDVVQNKVLVIPSLEWHKIKDEICTNEQAVRLVESWKNNAEFAWNDLSKLRKSEGEDWL